MPKLSRYISHETDIKADAIVFHEGDRPKLDDTSSQQQFGLNKLREEDRQPLTTVGRPSRLADVMKRRVQEYGERQYRWSDGTMRTSKPPRNPYAVSTRKSWSPLVLHCREHGGDREFTASHVSMRYGIKVTYTDHVEYLASLGLSPEVDEDGNFLEYDPDKTHPLKDPQHSFNSFYSEEAKNLFQ